MDKKADLLLVYNADSGIVNGLLDLAHKTFSPATYACALCGLSYGVLGMRRAWRTYLENLRVRLVFLHRDQFRQRWPAEPCELPIIALQGKGQSFRVLLRGSDFAGIGDLSALQVALDTALAQVPRSGTAEWLVTAHGCWDKGPDIS
jgi:hypothetical protein